jgi:hypothetical protein
MSEQPDLFGRSEPHIRDQIYGAIEAGYHGAANPHAPLTYFWSLHEEGRRARVLDETRAAAS